MAASPHSQSLRKHVNEETRKEEEELESKCILKKDNQNSEEHTEWD